MTLGLTNGTSNAGLARNNNYLKPYKSLFNVNIGIAASGSVLDSNDNKGLGVTTDPTKSGLITKFSNLTIGTIPSEKLGSFYIRY